MITLGLTVKDKITGVTGVVTGKAEYISGCAQCLVQPPVDEKGAYRDGHWFDEQRLDAISGVEPVALDNSETPGGDIPAPIR